MWCELPKLAAQGKSAESFSEIIVWYMSILTVWKLAHTYILSVGARQVDGVELKRSN